jgi:hypothetical protein
VDVQTDVGVTVETNPNIAVAVDTTPIGETLDRLSASLAETVEPLRGSAADAATGVAELGAKLDGAVTAVAVLAGLALALWIAGPQSLRSMLR